VVIIRTMTNETVTRNHHLPVVSWRDAASWQLGWKWHWMLLQPLRRSLYGPESCCSDTPLRRCCWSILKRNINALLKELYTKLNIFIHNEVSSYLTTLRSPVRPITSLSPTGCSQSDLYEDFRASQTHSLWRWQLQFMPKRCEKLQHATRLIPGRWS
jgi:hypothetical protein